MQTENKIDAITLRKSRELKGLNRKEAGALLGVSFKAIEKFENGRTTLNRTRIDNIISAYGLSYDDFCLCRDGKMEQLKSKYGQKEPKIIESKSLRRSYKKIITKEVIVLKALRNLRSLSQAKASFLCGYHRTAIGCIENGRVELSRKRIRHIVESYGFAMGDFEYHMKSKKLITDIQSECIAIIRALPEEKLNVVYPLLTTFK